MKKLYKKILCPIDFSPYSAMALKEAVRLAKIYNGKLIVVHIVVNPWSALYETKNKGIMQTDEIKNLVQGMIRDFTEEHVPGLSYECCIKINDHIYGQIIHCARQKQADLIVLASHGLNNNRSLSMGSVAENIVRRAPVSVFVVRG